MPEIENFIPPAIVIILFLRSLPALISWLVEHVVEPRAKLIKKRDAQRVGPATKMTNDERIKMVQRDLVALRRRLDRK